MASCAVLALAIAPVAILVAALCNRGLSSDALVCAGLGGGVCWLAATLALTATFLGCRFHAPVQGVLAGMLFRMGLPLAAMVVFPRVDGLREIAGVTTTILGVYLIALVIETMLAIRMVPQHASSMQVAQQRCD
jgi:hypothetical protein